MRFVHMSIFHSHSADIKASQNARRGDSEERRMRSCSHRKWQTCWPDSVFWLNSLSLFRVVNYPWALKNLREGKREGEVGKINAVNGAWWGETEVVKEIEGGRHGRRAAIWGEEGLDKKKKRDKEKQIMQISAGSLPFQNSAKEITESGEKHIFGLRQIHSHSPSLHFLNSFSLPRSHTPVPSLISQYVISYFCAHLASDFPSFRPEKSGASPHVPKRSHCKGLRYGEEAVGAHWAHCHVCGTDLVMPFGTWHVVFFCRKLSGVGKVWKSS